MSVALSLTRNPFPLTISPKLPKNPSSSSSSPRRCRICNSSSQNCNELKFIRNKKLLKDVSSWGIGGPCNYFVSVSSSSHLLSAISYCEEHSIRYMVIGKGSNCLFDDLGFDGCVIVNQMELLEREQSGIYRVGSGFPFYRLGVQCSNEGFSGLEFAGGIPGTVGGAIFMNAGANGQETANTVQQVEIITREGKFETLHTTHLQFGYRSSSFQTMKDLAAIVAATFKLQPSTSAKTRLQQIMTRRRTSQPLGERSAGSVFRNPSNAGVAAAELIERAGLKGYRIGGAMVSRVHANFFINCGGSTSQDMLNLIALVKEKVDHKFGVQLKEEVLYVHPYLKVQKLI